MMVQGWNCVKCHWGCCAAINNLRGGSKKGNERRFSHWSSLAFLLRQMLSVTPHLCLITFHWISLNIMAGPLIPWSTNVTPVHLDSGVLFMNLSLNLRKTSHLNILLSFLNGARCKESKQKCTSLLFICCNICQCNACGSEGESINLIYWGKILSIKDWDTERRYFMLLSQYWFFKLLNCVVSLVSNSVLLP